MTSGHQAIVLAAGGTGGHLFPAQALAEELRLRGHAIHLMTDERVHDYGKDFPADQVHVVPSATLGFSEPLRLPGRLWKLYGGYRKARSLLGGMAPAAVVGFGGYPSLPPLMAATHLHIPTIVHEQNSVLGRANRLLSSRVTAVATSFRELTGVPDSVSDKFVFTGNPVRAVVKAVAGARYPEVQEGGLLHVLVFGGSQGARVFADLMPATLALLSVDLRRRLRITQQCRPEDMERTESAYQMAGVEAHLNSFFADMPQRMAQSHLVICRSGASSVAELGVVGRPAVLLPLPHAIDNDQLRNAEAFAAAGAGWLHSQNDLDPATFAAILTRLLSNGATLKEAAAAALKQGKPDAAQALASLVEHIIVAPVSGPKGTSKT